MGEGKFTFHTVLLKVAHLPNKNKSTIHCCKEIPSQNQECSLAARRSRSFQRQRDDTKHKRGESFHRGCLLVLLSYSLRVDILGCHSAQLNYLLQATGLLEIHTNLTQRMGPTNWLCPVRKYNVVAHRGFWKKDIA